MIFHRLLTEKRIRRMIPYSGIICLVGIALTIAAAPRAIKLMSNLKTELSYLLPDHYPSVSLGNEVKKKFKKKGGGDLVLLVDSQDPKANQEGMLELAHYLSAEPEIERVKYIKTGYGFLDKHKLLYLELDDLKEIKNRIWRKIGQEKLGGLYIDFEQVEPTKRAVPKEKDPFDFDDLIEKYRDDYSRAIKNPYYSNADETVYAIWIYPKSRDGSLGYYKKFFNLIDEKVRAFQFSHKDSPVKIHYAGSIRTRMDEYHVLIQDLKSAGMISFVGIFLLLLLYFRSMVRVILLFFPLSSGVLLGFALCSFFITSLNVVTSFLFSILFGLGVDIGIHMLARYLEDRKAGLPMEDAIVNILLKTGRSSSIGVITTCASFFILVINDFRGFSEFGWIAGIGLLVTLLVHLLFFPALIVICERWNLLGLPKKPFLTMDASPVKIRCFPKPQWGVAFCFVFLILCFFMLPKVSFEWNYSILKIHLPDREEARTKLRMVTGRVNMPAAIMISSEEDALELKEEIKRRKKKDSASPSIDFFRSSFDLLPRDQKEKMEEIHAIGSLLEDDALNGVKGEKRKMIVEFKDAIRKTDFIEKAEIPSDVLDVFFGRDEYASEQIAFVYPLPKLELDDGRNAVAFYNDVHEIKVKSGKTFYAVSDSIVFADVLQTMFRDSRVAILLSLVVLLIVIYLDFFNWKKTGLVIAALCFGLVGMGGLVVLFGWRFNFYNMITIPTVIGMGEDNSVHLIHRYEELGQSSVMKALKSAGSAALMASLTTIIGYAGLIFSHHPGLRTIGIFAVVGMGTCTIGSLIFLPALLECLAKKK